MYEYLQGLFGTAEDGSPNALTFDQLVEKLKTSKDIKLANLSEGGYVSKEKFDAKETELTGVKQQLDTANETIKSYQDMDIDGIKQSVTDWEKKYNDDTKALQEKMAAQERAHNEELFLKEYSFTSKAAEAGVRAEFVKRNFPFENGSFLGGKEFMETLKADDDYKAAFVTEADPNPAGQEEQGETEGKPKFSTGGQQQIKPKPKKSLAELMIQKNENPNAKIIYD